MGMLDIFIPLDVYIPLDPLPWGDNTSIKTRALERYTHL